MHFAFWHPTQKQHDEKADGYYDGDEGVNKSQVSLFLFVNRRL
jgi:hypothetical protein